MIAPITARQQQLIAKNLIAACKDISKLNGTGYKFIYQASGFIAHYDINGFKSYYEDHSLQDDIEQNARFNMWGNFNKHDDNYEYYMSRKETYQRVLGAFAAQQFIKDHVLFVAIP
jgi:hypothetical protein